MADSSQVIILKSRITTYERNIKVFEKNIRHHTKYIRQIQTKASRSKDVSYKTHVAKLIRSRKDAINVNKKKLATTKTKIYSAKAKIKALSYR